MSIITMVVKVLEHTNLPLRMIIALTQCSSCDRLFVAWRNVVLTLPSEEDILRCWGNAESIIPLTMCFSSLAFRRVLQSLWPRYVHPPDRFPSSAFQYKGECVLPASLPRDLYRPCGGRQVQDSDKR